MTPSSLLFAQSETSQIYPLEYAQSLVDNLNNAKLFVVKGKFEHTLPRGRFVMETVELRIIDR